MSDVSLAVPITASLSLALGLAGLYVAWRSKAPRTGWRRYALPGGWALIALGLGGWCLRGKTDVALSLACVVLMCLALACVVAHGATIAPNTRPEKLRPESENDGLELGAGYWGRFAVRLLGCLIVVPAVGLMAGALWRAYVPGDAADRLIGMATVAVLVMATALVVLLASTKPYRTTAVLTTTALAAAALVYLPMMMKL